MDRVCIDVCGPFPLSEQGNKYILVVWDSFTRWIGAYAMPDQTAKTIANILMTEFFSRLGLPLELHSDQGRSLNHKSFNKSASCWRSIRHALQAIIPLEMQ